MTTLLETPTSKFRALGRLVGNTPMVSIHYRYHGRERTIFAKCEYLSLTGSIKDRMALRILQQALAEAKIQPGWTIAEATSGNTGIAFAAIGRMLGHPVRIFMPDWMSQERVQLIQSYGADIVKVSKDEGGFKGCIQRCEEFASGRSDVFLPRQFSNSANTDAHAESTAPELWSQLASVGKRPEAFVAGVGTGGTIMGVARYLRERDLNIRIHPVEPAESPTLSTGCKAGSHRIQGISDEFIPAIVQLDQLNEVISVSDGDSILMAQKLAKTLGLAVGISSGCNFVAAVRAQEMFDRDASVVTVFCDDSKKYLSTALTQVEPERPGYLAPEIELLSLGTVGRACEFCH